MNAGEMPRIRLTSVPDEALLVVRGDELDVAVLRADAERFRRRYPGWGRYGVSAFVATDDAEVDALCETRLERFGVVVVFLRRDLEAAGLEVVPTFRRPHVTLAHADLPALVDGLLGCEHRTQQNPHFEPG
jgi:hypothetical protein